MELLLRLNGHHAAWPAKFADPGPRAADVRRDPYRAANTSMSFILRHRDELLLHVLVDAGLGVVNSLLELQDTAGIDRVDAVVLTHPHFDHVAGLDWLFASCSRSTVPGQPWPLPVYCSTETRRAVFGRRGLFHWWRDSMSHTAMEPGVARMIDGSGGAALTFTGVPVEHGPTAPGAMIYAVEVDDAGVRRKVGLAWDMLRLAPDADPTPLVGCDLLFVDTTTVHPQPKPDKPDRHRNWHISLEESLGLIAGWAPRRTYLVHYSGSHDEDPPEHACTLPDVTRALTHHELKQLAARIGAEQARDLRVAGHGLIIPHHEPWPEPVAGP